MSSAFIIKQSDFSTVLDQCLIIKEIERNYTEEKYKLLDYSKRKSELENAFKLLDEIRRENNEENNFDAEIENILDASTAIAYKILTSNNFITPIISYYDDGSVYLGWYPENKLRFSIVVSSQNIIDDVTWFRWVYLDARKGIKETESASGNSPINNLESIVNFFKAKQFVFYESSLHTQQIQASTALFYDYRFCA
ncbi:MAG: hypothetical protein QM538_05505 [Methylacidiphilales bacterium]|nr:hypothetical protein [Candidatus Methylacidiphilales bacterium]